MESATRGCELGGYGDGYFLGTLAASYAELGDFPKRRSSGRGERTSFSVT